MYDDLKLKISVMHKLAMRDIKDFTKALNTAKLTADKLEDSLKHQRTTLVSLGQQLKNTNTLKQRGLITDKQHEKETNRLKKAIRQTSIVFTGYNKELKSHNHIAIKSIQETNSLSNSQNHLKRSTDSATRSQKLQNAALRQSNLLAARRSAAIRSGAASIGRAGFTKGGMISAGAALGSGGMFATGAGMIGLGATLGGAAAIFKSAQTGMDLEAIVADVITRPGESIDPKKLRASIKRLNSQSAFNLGDVGEAYKSVRRSGGYGLTELEGVVENALLFGQAEDLSASTAADMLINATGMLNRKVDKKNTNEVANLISATASLSTSNARDVYNALKSSANEVMGIGGASELQTLAGIALMSGKGFKGSANATFRTAMAKDKGTNKIRETADALGDRTGEFIDLTTAEGSPLAIYGTLQNLAKIKGKFANDEVAQNLIAKLMHDAFGARGEGKTGGLLDEMIKDPKILEKKMKEIEFAAKNNIVQQLSDAKLDTTGGIIKLLLSELSNTLDSIFVPILQPVISFIGKDLKAGLIDLAVFLDSNKGFTDAIKNSMLSMYTLVKGIGSIGGNLIVALAPALESVTSITTILSPVFGILNGILSIVNGVLGGIGLLGRFIGQMLGWVTGGLVAWIKWLGSMMLNAFNPEGRKKATQQRDLDIAKYTKAGADLGGAVGELAAPFAVGWGIGVAAKTFQAAQASQALTVLGPGSNTGTISKLMGTMGRHPITSGAITGALGGTTHKTWFDQAMEAERLSASTVRTGTGPMQATFNITIDGATDPSKIAETIQKHFEQATFSMMEVPLN